MCKLVCISVKAMNMESYKNDNINLISCYMTYSKDFVDNLF